MNAHRISQEYRNGVEEFLQFARENGKPHQRGTIQAKAVHFASSKDKNPITAFMSYFRVIQDIWEIDYVTFRVPVFKCKWIDGNTGVQTDDLRFTLVDLNKVGYKDEPFIMAYQARQIFYVRDPCNEKWSVVLEGRTMHVTHEDESLDIHETRSFSSRSFGPIADNEMDEIHAKKKMLSALATRWRDFKTFLTREYVFRERQNETPCKKLMKARAEASGVESADLVDPPPCYEMWIAARTKSDGQMTSESARVITDKIEGLVEKTTQGSFVPHGWDDILTMAIGRLEHPGRVRGIGGSWSHQDYFGAPPSRSSTVDSCSQEPMQRMEMQFEEKLNNIRQEFEQKFKLLARSQQQIAVANDGVRVSTKGSCAAPDPSGEKTHTDVPNQCELYVKDDPPRLVAIGRVFEGGLTIHGVPLEPDWTRVVVDQVQDAAGLVPLPNTEIQLVGHATGTFLAWSKRLVMPLSARAKVILLLLFYILIILLLFN
uniref:Uncharacterized protein n=1 Tax=Cajanus cajan TaxID=3821 RepID=A0A151R1Q2_CAJCA|nr:hypothetical protein KK1_042375 [Cajanus cajan]